MKRLSKRELRRKLDELEVRHGPNTDAALFVAPDEAFANEDLPDVDVDDEIRVPDPETGQPTVVVPHHRPTQWWEGGLPVVAEAHVAAVWQNMDAEQFAREREIREEHDQPIPPILKATT